MLNKFYFISPGLIGQLKPEVFSLLMKLQNKMTSVVKSIGNIDHEEYPYSNLHARCGVCVP